MAIVNTIADTLPTTVFASSGNTAITFMSLCNFSDATQTVSIFVIPNGNTPTAQFTVVSELSIMPKDTYEFYHGAEKIILSDGDYIAVSATTPDSVAVFVSYTGF